LIRGVVDIVKVGYIVKPLFAMDEIWIMCFRKRRLANSKRLLF